MTAEGTEKYRAVNQKIKKSMTYSATVKIWKITSGRTTTTARKHIT